MATRAWCICEEDNFGEIDLQHLYGYYQTKKEAEVKLMELTKKYGKQPYVIRHVCTWYNAFHFPKKGGIA